MNTKAIASTAVFTALTIMLTRILIPAPYLPILFYEIWEIPVVAALFLIGPKEGALVLLLTTGFSFLFFPALANPAMSPAAGLVACGSMLIGVFLGSRLSFRLGLAFTDSKRKSMIISTVLGIVFRVVIMTAFVYAVFVLILGNPAHLIIAILPFISVFNVTLPLYTIPIGYLIAKATNRAFKITTQQ
jgi:riboflavin transporter FmnP